MFTVEDKAVKVRFMQGKKKAYSIQWTELEVPFEVPFENIEDVFKATEFLAPYVSGNSTHVNFSPAMLEDEAKGI